MKFNVKRKTKCFKGKVVSLIDEFLQVKERLKAERYSARGNGVIYGIHLLAKKRKF